MLTMHANWTKDQRGWADLDGSAHHVAFAGNERLLVVTESLGPSVRDLLTGEIVWLPGWPQQHVRRACLSPDRTLLALKYGLPHVPSTCTLWNIQQGIELGPLEDREKMASTLQMTISPDNRWLAMTLRWNTLPGSEQILAETGHIPPKYYGYLGACHQASGTHPDDERVSSR